MTEADRDVVDVVVVGAGFAGLYGLIRFREQGLSVRGIEAGDDVGGVWYWNRYPGARCDIQSIDYSYGFDEELQQEWVWTERYAPQSEILAYLQHVAERYRLRPLIDFGTRVTRARWDGEATLWQVDTDHGDSIRARFVVLATGQLSAALDPVFPGREEFTGRTLYTSRWPHEPVDLQGLRVGVIGTGASGIQLVPLIAEEAAQLVVFQRTANFTIPTLVPPLDPAELADVKRTYAERRAISRRSRTGYPERGRDIGAFDVSEEERQAVYEEAWAFGGVQFARAFNDQLVDDRSNRAAAEFVKAKIRSIVQDPEIAAALTPDHAIGSRRVCTDQGYYECFNRPNVRLVNLRDDPIERFTPRGIRTTTAEHELDVIILATGFDAITGAVSRIDIVGDEGRTLREAWADGPETYLGLMSAGFPNLFMTTGAGSPSVLASLVPHSEQHIEWISDCIARLDAAGYRTIEPTVEAQDAWAETIERNSKGTVLSSGDSWYLGANVEGKPRRFMAFVGGLGMYTAICDEIAADDYRGFRRLPAADVALPQTPVGARPGSGGERQNG